MKDETAIAVVVVLALLFFYRLGLQPDSAPIVEASEPAAAEIVASSGYDYAAPPSISRDTYVAIWCEVGSAACDEAGQMYDILVQAGIDPVVEAAQASHETTLGTKGVGQPTYKNPHGVQCFSGDGRIADSSVPWGNGCAGVYASYSDAVATWARVIQNEYVGEGLATPALAVWKYAPTSDGNNPPAYIADMEATIDRWRATEPQQTTAPALEAAPAAPAAPAGAVASNPIAVGDDPCGWNVQVALDASGGTLRDVYVPPGSFLSFNGAMGDPAWIDYRTCAGVPGGNWCNLAARYAQVSRALGLIPEFQDHGVGDLGGGPENSVAIWNVGGQSGFENGSEDLIVRNTTGHLLRYRAEQSDGSVTIVAWLE